MPVAVGVPLGGSSGGSGQVVSAGGGGGSGPLSYGPGPPAGTGFPSQSLGACTQPRLQIGY